MDLAAREHCLFCLVPNSSRDALEWYDRVLLESTGVAYAIAAVGAFVPGHILVAPLQHVLSIQRLPSPQKESFGGFLKKVIDRVEEQHGPTTVFEHGTCASPDRRRSACIEHAHVQIIPGTYSFDSLELRPTTYGSLEQFYSTSVPFDSYLMYHEPGGPVRCARDVGISQFFRRQVARELHYEEEWDYALYPRWETVAETIRSIDSVETSPDTKTKRYS